MKHITILALDGTIASTVTGPTDIFSLAGVLWKQICGVQPEPYKTFVRRKKPIRAIILSTQLENLFVAPFARSLNSIGQDLCNPI